MNFRHLNILAPLLCLILAACGSSEGLREDLGLTHRAPDEYRVYERPPLSVPPEFNLRPPVSGAQAAAAQSAEAQDKAHSKVLGEATTEAPGATIADAPTSAPAATAVPVVSSSELPGPADAQFLNNVGAAKANHDIRTQIDTDNINGVAPKSSGYLFGGKKDSDSVVDAPKENQRLQQDKAQNQPPTAGETPVVAPKDRGILGDIF